MTGEGGISEAGEGDAAEVMELVNTAYAERYRFFIDQPRYGAGLSGSSHNQNDTFLRFENLSKPCQAIFRLRR